jgi:thermitase
VPSRTLFDVERAIYFAVDHGAKVINVSFSTSSGALVHAIDYANSRGAICVASVGNPGKPTVVYPALQRNVIAVGSTTPTRERSTFSNYGDQFVELAAPGESLVTLYPGSRYAVVSGTSFSAALVSGGAALLTELEPSLTQRLASRYFDDGALKEPAIQMGNGRVDVFATARRHAVGRPQAPPPVASSGVALVTPSDGATVAGVVWLIAKPFGDFKVAGIEFVLDDRIIVATDTDFPYEAAWDSSTASNGKHVLSAVAHDASGNKQTTSVAVAVANRH